MADDGASVNIISQKRKEKMIKRYSEMSSKNELNSYLKQDALANERARIKSKMLGDKLDGCAQIHTIILIKVFNCHNIYV